LGVCQAQIAINDGFTVTIQTAGTAGKFQWGKGDFHLLPPDSYVVCVLGRFYYDSTVMQRLYPQRLQTNISLPVLSRV
jgi:hypothetical protein